MSQRHLREKKWDGRGREAAGDGATSCSVILVTLEKGNHPGEAYLRRGRRNALSRAERDSLEGPHEEAEIQRKALRRGKNLVFSEDTCLEKERAQPKMTPRKVGSGIETRAEKIGLEVSLVGVH